MAHTSVCHGRLYFGCFDLEKHQGLPWDWASGACLEVHRAGYRPLIGIHWVARQPSRLPQQTRDRDRHHRGKTGPTALISWTQTFLRCLPGSSERFRCNGPGAVHYDLGRLRCGTSDDPTHTQLLAQCHHGVSGSRKLRHGIQSWPRRDPGRVTFRQTIQHSGWRRCLGMDLTVVGGRRLQEGRIDTIATSSKQNVNFYHIEIFITLKSSSDIKFSIRILWL